MTVEKSIPQCPFIVDYLPVKRTFFSSPEPKVRVSYCHSAPSVVRPSSSSSVRPLTFHIFDFFSRTAWWILMKLGRDEVLMVPYKCCCFSARCAQGRIQGGAKIGHGGPLLWETSSDRKATTTNQMHSNDLEACGKKCCYFWFHSEVKFLTRFWRLFGLSHFCVFKCNFHVYKWEKAYTETKKFSNSKPCWHHIYN